MSAITDTGARIRQLHIEARDLADRAIEKAIEAGRLLCEVKEQLGHGEFGPWVEANCGFTDRTARRYMRLHNNRAELPQGVGVKAALEHLAEPKRTPVSALKDCDWVAYTLLPDLVAYVAPSLQHPGHSYVVAVQGTTEGGGDAQYLRRPIIDSRISDVLSQVAPWWRHGKRHVLPRDETLCEMFGGCA